MRIFYKGQTIETMRDGEGTFYVVNGEFSCNLMSEALEFIELIVNK